jgi:hypothetical protein
MVHAAASIVERSSLGATGENSLTGVSLASARCAQHDIYEGARCDSCWRESSQALAYFHET